MKSFSTMKRSIQKINRKTAGMLLIITAAFLCSKYWFQLALVQGNSMEPTISHLQFVLINKKTKSFSRGDIIVFRKPGIKGVLIKRIAAEPEDSVQIKEGQLFVNGVSCTEYGRTIHFAGRAEAEIVLAGNRYFVLGDNLDNSIDSRFAEIGDIRQEEILGKVLWIK